MPADHPEPHQARRPNRRRRGGRWAVAWAVATIAVLGVWAWSLGGVNVPRLSAFGHDVNVTARDGLLAVDATPTPSASIISSNLPAGPSPSPRSGGG